ncbi:unnamed protein product, partial [Cylicostephanus goldi]
ALPSPSTPCNNATQFDCKTTSDSERCIPVEWLCDGLKDCKNGLDESHCSYLHKCPTGDFICRTGECVSGRYKCDGEADCRGAEDEKGCDYSDKAAAVARYHFASWGFICDHDELPGAYDCPLGDDERNCTKNKQSELRSHELTSCEPGMILCADHAACFPKNWVCDGEKDCLDGSDEVDCELSVDNFLAETVTELCKAGEHRCSGGTVRFAYRQIIPVMEPSTALMEMMKVHFVTNVAQERYLANINALTRHLVRNLGIISISGSHCICPHGSELSPGEHTCSQINECETPEAKQCQHYCEDRHAR